MHILAIDPGTTKSAYVRWDGNTIFEHGIVDNETMLDIIGMAAPICDVMAIERIASYGMAVGKEVFETAEWTGRFWQRWVEYGKQPRGVYRKDVKLHHCHTTKAKDANISQALRDRFGDKGTKREPGITYGISKDIWQAFALAVYCVDTAPLAQ